MKCIKCNKETTHSICEACVGSLMDGMSIEDLIAHALVGRDVLKGKTNLADRLAKYKEKLKGIENI